MRHHAATPTTRVSPRGLYRTLATAEMVTWALLILGMIGKYAVGLGDWPVRVGGSVHGFVFLGYCVATVVVWTDRKWPTGTGVLGLVLAIVPFATLPFERHVERRGLLSSTWRIAPAGTPTHDVEDHAPHRAAAPTECRLAAPAAEARQAAAAPRERAHTPAEKLLAVILRWPVLSGLALVAVVAVLFTVLLNAGPPTEWFS